MFAGRTSWVATVLQTSQPSLLLWSRDVLCDQTIIILICPFICLDLCRSLVASGQEHSQTTGDQFERIPNHWIQIEWNRFFSLYKSWEWQYFNSWSSIICFITPLKKNKNKIIRVYNNSSISCLNHTPFIRCLPQLPRFPRDNTTCEGQGWNFEVAEWLQTSRSVGRNGSRGRFEQKYSRILDVWQIQSDKMRLKHSGFKG